MRRKRERCPRPQRPRNPRRHVKARRAIPGWHGAPGRTGELGDGVRLGVPLQDFRPPWPHVRAQARPYHALGHWSPPMPNADEAESQRFRFSFGARGAFDGGVLSVAVAATNGTIIGLIQEGISCIDDGCVGTRPTRDSRSSTGAIARGSVSTSFAVRPPTA
jgi:hypothetical protein